MANQRKPYIGMTGFKTYDEVAHVSNRIVRMPIGYFMFGVTCSDKRLKDPLSEGKTSPKITDLSRILGRVPEFHLPMIHYFTSEPDSLAKQVVAIYLKYEIDKSQVGLQLNATWPDRRHLENIRKIVSAPITLQLPKETLQQEDFINRLLSYDGLIDYALIDPSGGLGQEGDLRLAAKLMIAMLEKTRITPGVAGGFGPDNVAHKIKQLRELSTCTHCDMAKLTDNYCIDAQGKLREEVVVQPAWPADAKPLSYTQISTNIAESYIQNALAAFS